SAPPSPPCATGATSATAPAASGSAAACATGATTSPTGFTSKAATTVPRRLTQPARTIADDNCRRSVLRHDHDQLRIHVGEAALSGPFLRFLPKTSEGKRKA